MTNPIGITKRARVMDSEVLARFVQAKMVKAFRDVRPFVEELWKRFAALKPGQHIHGCATKKEYCENILQRTPRAVQYMLAGGNPENEKRKTREIISRPALPAATEPPCEHFINAQVGDDLDVCGYFFNGTGGEAAGYVGTILELGDDFVMIEHVGKGKDKLVSKFGMNGCLKIRGATHTVHRNLTKDKREGRYDKDEKDYRRRAYPSAPTSEAVDAEFVDEPVSQSAEKEPRPERTLEGEIEKLVEKVALQPYGYYAAKFKVYPEQHTTELAIVAAHKIELYEYIIEFCKMKIAEGDAAKKQDAPKSPASASPAKEIRIAAAQKEYDSTVGFNRQTRKAARERLEAAKKDAPASPAPPKEEKFMRMNLSSGKRPEARTDDELLKAIAYARKNQEWYPSQLENILEQVKPFIGEALKRGLTVPVAPAPKAKP